MERTVAEEVYADRGTDSFFGDEEEQLQSVCVCMTEQESCVCLS